MDWSSLQGAATSATLGGIVFAGVVWLGKTWVLPLLTRVFDNSLANASGSGNLLTTITAERDQWKARAIQLDSDLQEMRKEWAQMKSDVQLLQYQLKEARDEIANLTGKPLSTEAPR